MVNTPSPNSPYHGTKLALITSAVSTTPTADEQTTQLIVK